MLSDFQHWTHRFLQQNPRCKCADESTGDQCTSKSDMIIFLYDGSGEPIPACSGHADDFETSGDYGVIFG